MRLFGDNSTYGTEPVEFASKRTVGVTVAEGLKFPEGIRGLIPVTSKRKKGGTKTVYAFPTAEGDSGELEASDELAVITDGVELANRLLAQAAELAHIDLGQIFGVAMGITEDGYGFTRVEVVPIDEHNRPSETPIHLHIETSDTPGEPGTVNAVIALDAEGVPARVLITEFNERGATIRVNVNVNEKTGKLSVQKVEDIRGGDSRLLYKRGWTPKGAEYIAARREGRPGGERGGKFVRDTGRAVPRPRPEQDEEDERDEAPCGRDGRDFRDNRRNQAGQGRPVRRDEVPGMRRIDGSSAKRGGTFPGRGDDRFDERSRRDDRRGPCRDDARGSRDDYRGPRDDRRGSRDDYRGPRDDRRGSGSSAGGRSFGGERGERSERGQRSGGFERSGNAGRPQGGNRYGSDGRSGGFGSNGRSGGNRPQGGNRSGNGGRPQGGRPQNGGRSGNGGSRRSY